MVGTRGFGIGRLRRVPLPAIGSKPTTLLDKWGYTPDMNQRTILYAVILLGCLYAVWVGLSAAPRDRESCEQAGGTWTYESDDHGGFVYFCSQ